MTLDRHKRGVCSERREMRLDDSPKTGAPGQFLRAAKLPVERDLGQTALAKLGPSRGATPCAGYFLRKTSEKFDQQLSLQGGSILSPKLVA
jgi:hypothetical protein